MFKKIITLVLVIIGVVGFSIVLTPEKDIVTGAPPYGEPESAAPSEYDPYPNWLRPDVPVRVGLQVGHYQNEDLPEELHRLTGNTGATGGGWTEAEVNLQIANLIRPILEERGVLVDILPTVVPPEYWADVFVAIHADGSEDPSKSGYKFAGPWRDYTGKSDDLVAILDRNYELATGFQKDPNITRNMRGYYAFSWWRYDHSIHPMTTAVIAETGFLTNWYDRQIIVEQPEISARAIADSIIEFLESEGLV